MGSRKRRVPRWLTEEVGGMPMWGVVASAAFILALGAIALASMPQQVSAETTRSAIPAPSFTLGVETAESAPESMVVIIGDSYSAGDPGDPQSDRWTSLVAAQQGWQEANFAVGGTGYATGVSNYPEAIAAIPENVMPAQIIVSGGRNDPSDDLDSFRVGVDSTFAALSERFPGVPIAVTLPLGDDDSPLDPLNAKAQIVSEVAEGYGIRVVDLGQPLAGRPDLLKEDSIHPNEAGHQAIAEAFNAAW